MKARREREKAWGRSPQATPEATAWPDLAGVHAFLIEDNEDTRTLVSETLQHCGALVSVYPSADAALADLAEFLPTVFISDLSMPGLDGPRVSAVGTLTEAQRGFDRYKPDLVVCDVKLPDGTGLDFVVWLRARRKDQGRDIPCLALTGFEPHPPGRAIGFDAYMRKPVDLAKLCNVASALIGRAKP